MIWRLIRLEMPLTILLLPLTIVPAAMAALATSDWSPAMQGGFTGGYLGYTAVMWWILLRFPEHASKLAVSLPISTRVIFLSRVASTMVALWLPVACSGLVLCFGEEPRMLLWLIVVRMTAALSVGALAVQNIEVKRMRMSMRWVMAVSVVPLALAGLAALVLSTRTALVGSFVGCVALLYVALRRLPAAFEWAPSGTQTGEVARAKGSADAEEEGWPLMPAIRVLYPWPVLVFLPCLLIGAGNLLACAYFISVCLAPRTGEIFLDALPIPRRTSLVARLAPFLVFYTAGVLFVSILPAGFHSPGWNDASLFARLAQVPLVAALIFAQTLLFHMVRWRRLRSVSATVRGWVSVAAIFILPAALMAAAFWGWKSGPVLYALCTNPVDIVIIIAAAIVLAWLVDLQWRELDPSYADVLVVRAAMFGSWGFTSGTPD